MYIDGDLHAEIDHITQGNPALWPTFDAALGVGIGARPNAGQELLDVDVDELRLWATVRTDAEILGNYNLALDTTEHVDELIGLWRFTALFEIRVSRKAALCVSRRDALAPIVLRPCFCF